MVPDGATPASPGFDLLVACVLAVEARDLAEPLQAAIDSGEDLVGTAAFHGLPSLLYLCLREAGVHSSVPPDQWQKLSAGHAAFVAHELRILEAAAEALGLLRNSRISRFLPVKGVAWAALLQSEHIPRDISDADIVVAAPELGPAREALIAAGFTPGDGGLAVVGAQHHPPALTRDGVKVEIHRSLWEPARLPGRMPPLGDMIERSQEGSLLGEAVQVPSSEDMALLTAALIARDRFDVRLRHYAELYRLLNHPRLAPDPERLDEIARDCGLSRARHLVAVFMDELFAKGGAEVSRLPPRLRAALWRRLAQGAQAPHVPAALLDLVTAVTQRQATRGGGYGAREEADEPPLTALIRSAVRAGRYGLSLVGSSTRRRELIEEIVIRRALRA